MEPDNPRILVIDDDVDILKSIEWLLEDAEYLPTLARTLEAGRYILDTTGCHCVVMDLFGHDLAQSIPLAKEVRQQAFPTPVGIMTAHHIPPEQDELREFAFVLAKPFQIDEFLSLIAASLNTPLTAEQHAQAIIVHQYFAALSNRDWDGVAALCTDDVVFASPGETPLSTHITGKAAFRQYTEQTLEAFPEAVFTTMHIYPTPTGLAARYQASWQPPQSTQRHAFSGGILLRFRGEQIMQIGVRLNRAALQPPQ
jgi:ketosteroid isomerase-like protein/CheY-like chemotaxis protein